MTTDHDTLLTIAEAAKFAGVSTRTVRRWLDQGHVPDERKVKDKRTPVVISQRHLVAFLSAREVTPTRGHAVGRDIGRVPTDAAIVSQGELDAVKGQVTALNRLIEELQKDKTRMIEELTTERERVRTLNERISNLERELHSVGGTGKGIKGYLTDGWKKLIKR